MLKLKSIKLASSGYDYSAVMGKLSEPLSKKIKDWCLKEIPHSDIYIDSKEPEKYGRESDIHFTVKYGLHTNNVEEIKKVVDGFGSFEVTLGEISRFTPQDKPYDVLKIEVKGNKLIELHEKLNALKNSDEHDTYRAHVTIAYINSGSNKNMSGRRDFYESKVRIDKLVFSPINGAKVTIPLGEWK